MTYFSSLVIPSSSVAEGSELSVGYNTFVLPSFSGVEYREDSWTDSRRRYTFSAKGRTQAQLDAIREIFYSTKGRAHSVSLLDPVDNTVTTTTGIAGNGFGDGLPDYQLYRKYTVGSNTVTRKVGRIVSFSPSPVCYVNGSPVTAFFNAPTDGRVNISPFTSRAVSEIVAGNPTLVRCSAAVGDMDVNDKLYLSGVIGGMATTLNSKSHLVLAVANWTTGKEYSLQVDTTGLTYTNPGSAYDYPQPDETLTWTGSFYTPVRFDSDELLSRIVGKNAGGFLYDIDPVELIEVLL